MSFCFQLRGPTFPCCNVGCSPNIAALTGASGLREEMARWGPSKKVIEGGFSQNWPRLSLQSSPMEPAASEPSCESNNAEASLLGSDAVDKRGAPCISTKLNANALHSPTTFPASCPVLQLETPLPHQWVRHVRPLLNPDTIARGKTKLLTCFLLAFVIAI